MLRARKLTALLYAGTALFVLPGIAEAADITWDGPVSNGSWITAANWSTNTVPTSADTAVIGAGVTRILPPNGQTIDIGSVYITADALLDYIGQPLSNTTITRIYGVNGIGLRY